MSEQQGFKNAQWMKEFRQGMRVRCDGGNWLIVDGVTGGGSAVCREQSILGEDVGSLWPMLIPRCDLDLDSIWVGRHYMGSPRVGDNEAVVRMVNDDFVMYTEGSLKLCDARADFLRNYEPLPLEPAKIKITVTEPECACVGPRSKCEGCEKPAVTRDNEGVPLCQTCADGLKKEATAAQWHPGDSVQVKGGPKGKVRKCGCVQVEFAPYQHECWRPDQLEPLPLGTPTEEEEEQDDPRPLSDLVKILRDTRSSDTSAIPYIIEAVQGIYKELQAIKEGKP